MNSKAFAFILLWCSLYTIPTWENSHSNGIEVAIPIEQVLMLHRPSKNQALCEYYTHVSMLKPLISLFPF